jgi:hypothetical protein
MVVQRLRSWSPLRGFLDPGHLFLFAKESTDQQDCFLGIHRHLWTRNTSALESLDIGEDPLIFLRKGTDRDIVLLVGFSSLCCWKCARMVINQMDNQNDVMKWGNKTGACLSSFKARLKESPSANQQELQR